MSVEPAPCQCMSTPASVSPTHHGHCCFWPATQTCHLDEMREWQREHERIWGPSPEPLDADS